MTPAEWFASVYARAVTAARTSTFRLLATICASSIFTAAGLLTYQTLQRRLTRKALRDSIESHFPASSRTASVYGKDDQLDDEVDDFLRPRGSLTRNASMDGVEARAVDEEIIKEQLARNIAFLGEEAVARIRTSHVVVVGLGGVGSAAATILLRSGVGRIRLIDFDQVTLSSLNRHTVATLADVGISKVVACKRRFREIAPWVTIDARNELFSLNSAESLLEGQPDWVIDCIDNIQTKCELLKFCHDRKIKVFSAMGAGGKCDPTRIQISDISTTFEDPLARSVRQMLRRKGVSSGIPVVYSTEVPSTQGKLLPLPEEEFKKGLVQELSALDNFRVRILPVLGPLPCMFGQAAAAYIIAQLAGNVHMRPLAVKNRHKVYHRLIQELSGRELALSGSNKLPINEDDSAYLFEEIFQGRSVIAPLFQVCSKPSLLRWDRARPVTWDNLVVMEREEGQKHMTACLQGGSAVSDVWSSETVKVAELRLKAAGAAFQQRLAR